MDIHGKDFNFYLKAFSPSEITKTSTKELVEAFEDEYEDKRVSCMIYENSSIYSDPSNNLDYGSSLSEGTVEDGFIYLIKYYFYHSSNYTIDLKNFKKGKIEGFPLLTNMKNADLTPFFGLPLTSISIGKEEYWLELQDSSDSTETRMALFHGNEFGYAELIFDTSLEKKTYKTLISKKIDSLTEKGKSS